MSFNGSGTFNRVHNWVSDRDSSIPVTASRMDAEDDGFATGLSTCITKDGQTTVTANLPMAGFRHTGVGNASARNHYSVVGQHQDSSYVFAVGGGTANAQTLTLAPAITAYADGMVLHFEAGATNTGNTTLNVNSVGAQSVVLPNGDEIPAGSITSGNFYTVIYDLTNTNWILIGGASVQSDLSIISANTTQDVVSITANSLSSANALTIFSTSDNTGTRSLVDIEQNGGLATGTTCLNVTQAANNEAVVITSENTTSVGVDMVFNSLSSGPGVRIYSNSSDGTARDLVLIHNDNSSAGDTSCLTLNQDANEAALSIVSDATTAAGISYIGQQTTGDGVSIVCNDLTNGNAVNISSTSTDSGDRDLLFIHNDNASASSTQCASFLQDSVEIAIRARCTNASYTGNTAQFVADRAASTAYHLSQWVSGGTTGDTEFRFRGDGEAFADGSFTGGGADYAEYFEWEDGNPDNEDRRGIAVELVGEKISPATSKAKAIGVISGNPSVVGDSAWNKWNHKFLTDDYGSYIMEDYEVWQWFEDDDLIVTEAEKITDDMVVPDDKKVIVQQRRKLNPVFDPTLEYIPREDRPEWGCVGMMGKLRVRKGQFTNSRWIKMRDVSDKVEEWLVK